MKTYNVKNGCDMLVRIIIPNSVTSIERMAFWKCTSLKSVTIPNSVASIEVYAFDDCYNLASVTFQSMITETNFSSFSPFPGDLRDKYFAGGIGTYTNDGSDTWTKQ
jgi:hypothetical protein